MDLGSGIRDPGSGKNLFRITDPGVKKAPDPGSATLLLVRFLEFTITRKFSKSFAAIYNNYPKRGEINRS
jgi:hypothetical protein